MTPQQIKQITDNLNYLVEQANYHVKVTFEHRLWWLQGFSRSFTGEVDEVALINVDDDDETGMYVFDEKELQSMAVEVLAQVSLGA